VWRLLPNWLAILRGLGLEEGTAWNNPLTHYCYVYAGSNISIGYIVSMVLFLCAHVYVVCGWRTGSAFSDNFLS
jgi:hypothetical protein